MINKKYIILANSKYHERNKIKYFVVEMANFLDNVDRICWWRIAYSYKVISSFRFSGTFMIFFTLTQSWKGMNISIRSHRTESPDRAGLLTPHAIERECHKTASVARKLEEIHLGSHVLLEQLEPHLHLRVPILLISVFKN